MYFWNIEALKSALSNGTLSQADRFKYYLASIVLYLLAMETSYIFPSTYSTLLAIQSGLTFAINIAGVIYCYLQNRSGDDREFIDRMVCIGWVVSIRIIVFWIAAYFVYGIGGTVIGGDEFKTFTENHNFVDVAFCLFFTGLTYVLIGQHLTDVAHVRKPFESSSDHQI